ncbi:tail fiber assembly protein [Serratia fonticola]
MSYGYSATTNTFYVIEEKDDFQTNGTWPNDVTPITDEEWNTYRVQGLRGKVRGADAQGRPCWIDAPQLTLAQQIEIASWEKAARLEMASKAIAPLQDADDLRVATAEEKARLLAWKRYRVLINRVDTESVPDIDWPIPPDT